MSKKVRIILATFLGLVVELIVETILWLVGADIATMSVAAVIVAIGLLLIVFCVQLILRFVGVTNNESRKL